MMSTHAFRGPGTRRSSTGSRLAVSPRLLAAWTEINIVPAPPREGFRAITSPFFAAGVLGAALGGFVLLTRVARGQEPGRLDIATTRLLQRRHSPLATRAMVIVSGPGFAPLEHILTLGTALDLWVLRRRREAVYTLLTMGAGAIAGLVKIAVGRPRPAPQYVRAAFHFRDNSFPSGHCAHYTSFYGFLIYMTCRTLPPSPIRDGIVGLSGGLIILVAPSRVYLGHHWTSDVLAGQLLGLIYCCLLIQAYEKLVLPL